MYNGYHRLHNPCKICVAKNLARYYQVNRDEVIAKSELYRKIVKNVRKSHAQQRNEPNNKVEELAQAMEMLILKKWIVIVYSVNGTL